MYGKTEVAANLLENVWLPGIGTFILNLIVTRASAGPGARGRHVAAHAAGPPMHMHMGTTH